MTAAEQIVVGTTLPPLEMPPISRATVALYAGASGDYTPIHIDTDAAHAAGLPGADRVLSKWKGCVSLSCVLRHGKYHSGPTGADLSLLGGGPD